MTVLTDQLAALERAPRFRFADWPNPAVPPVAAGVYAVWQEVSVRYIGMSGRGLSADAIASHRSASARNKGLFSRLASHAAGRRSGDQFCVYVADRLVLPQVSPETLRAIAAGEESFDQLVREFIHKHLSYSYVEVADGAAALRLEAAARGGGMSAGVPTLNPRRAGTARRGATHAEPGAAELLRSARRYDGSDGG
jgi:hypothetical protein